MYVYHIHAWYRPRPEEGIRSPGTRVTNSCGGLKENSPPKGVALFGGVVLLEEGVTVGVDFEI